MLHRHTFGILSVKTGITKKKNYLIFIYFSTRLNEYFDENVNTLFVRLWWRQNQQNKKKKEYVN